MENQDKAANYYSRRDELKEIREDLHKSKQEQIARLEDISHVITIIMAIVCIATLLLILL